MKKCIPLVFGIQGAVFAASITNNIDGVGPNGSIKPYICIQNQSGTVAPGQTGDANKASDNQYYAGSALRFGGCSSNNSYLGYVGFSISNSGNNSIASYSPPEGIHINWKNRAINSKGVVTGAMDYTAIAANPDLSPAHGTSAWNFAGINLSGLEFGKVIDPVVIPNLSIADSQLPYSDLSDMQSFIQKGINTVRVPLSWGYLQLDGPGVGEINESYYANYVRPLLQTLTHAKVNTIVDLHAYMRYSKFGEHYSGCGAEGPCPDGTLVTDEKAWQSVWSKLLARIQKDVDIDQRYLMLDLVNEPVGVPDDSVFTIQTSLIKMLRTQGFTGYILVEGNAWTGLHSWTNAKWTGQNGQTWTNSTLFSRANFAKAGITDLSHVLINVHQYLDSDYSGTHQNCLTDLNTTGDNGFNLTAFTNYLQENQLQAIVTEFGTGEDRASCAAPLKAFMQYMQDNSSKNKDYGFAGWTIWSTGHGWGNYNLRVKPDSYQMDVLSEFVTP